MKISIENLKKLLGEAFDLGYENIPDVKDDLLNDLMSTVSSEVEEYRVYKVKELKKMQEGTIFHHLTKGRCFVVKKKNGDTEMQFEKNSETMAFKSDNDPWDRPMMLKYSPPIG